MITSAIAAIALMGLLVWVLVRASADTIRRERTFEKERASWERERRELLDRIMYLANSPWSEPPSTQEEVVDVEEETYDALNSPIDSEYAFQPMGTV